MGLLLYLQGCRGFLCLGHRRRRRARIINQCPDEWRGRDEEEERGEERESFRDDGATKTRVSAFSTFEFAVVILLSHFEMSRKVLLNVEFAALNTIFC